MNRRDFLKKTLIGGASLVALPVISKANLTPPVIEEDLGGFTVPEDIAKELKNLAGLVGVQRKQATLFSGKENYEQLRKRIISRLDRV